jgi:hypothetical protein
MGMRVGVAEILEKISKMKRKDDRVKALRENSVGRN